MNSTQIQNSMSKIARPGGINGRNKFNINLVRSAICKLLIYSATHGPLSDMCE